MYVYYCKSFAGGSAVKNLPAMWETCAGDTGLILGPGYPLEKEITTHSSIFAWEIPWTEEPYGLKPIDSPKSRT